MSDTGCCTNVENEANSPNTLDTFETHRLQPISQQIIPLRISGSSPSRASPNIPPPTPLFSHLFESKKDSNDMDPFVLDEESLARQSVINNKVRDILKKVTRAPKKSINQEGSDYIDLASPTKKIYSAYVCSDENEISDSNGNCTQHQTQETTESSLKNGLETSCEPTGPSSFAVRCPALSKMDPPWYTFLGFARFNAKRLRKLKNKTIQEDPENLEPPYHDWMAALNEMNESLDFFGRLHEELYALVSWLEPTPEEILIRQRVLAKITIVAQNLWPGCTVLPFGSYFTGLWLPTGDMDIAIMGVEGLQILNLKMLTLCLIRLGIPIAVEIISSARVPIVKFIDSESGLSVDLSINTDSAVATSEFIHEQLEIYPWLRPLVLIIKLYLSQRNLGETYRGGIGSYLLFVLCLSFLQQHRSVFAPKLRSSLGLGHLVLDFFQLYGRDFNYDTTAISVRNGGRYFPKIERNWFNYERPTFLSVESPLAPELDIGRNSFEIRTIRSCFRQSFLTLVEKHAGWEDDTLNKSESLVKHFIFTIDPLMTRRQRVPLVFSGLSKLEKTEWWQSVKSYFNQPIALPRVKPFLSAALIKQVEQEVLTAGQSLAQTQHPTIKKDKRHTHLSTKKDSPTQKVSTIHSTIHSTPQSRPHSTTERSVSQPISEPNRPDSEPHTVVESALPKRVKRDTVHQIRQLENSTEVQHLQRLLDKKKMPVWEQTT